ncbi:hypothetical protein N7527_000851 [Penicillium freii]|uniref:Uncharacterized protein n=1 Tax=Penicillium freii TaxID=48697 RepID=A0A101MNN1_PENFR|nr:hypothetical protein N7527_000851 [Penicillium freii]KUM63868.1 hypothetical protein ACN42_g3223 [Penicillium freii]
MQPVPVWKKKLAELHYQSLHALRTEDFTFTKHLQVYHYSKPISVSYSADTVKVSPEVEKYMKEETTFACEIADRNYKEFSAEAEDLKKDPNPNGNSWRVRMGALKDKDIERTTANINRVFENIESKIDSLDTEAEKEAAFDIFSHGWTAFTNFLDTVLAWMGKLVDAVWDFLKGIWDKIKQGWEVVKAGFNAAVNFIKGIFGYSASSTADAIWSAGPVSERARPENAHAQSQLKREIERTRAKVGEILRDLEHRIDTLGNDTAGINRISTGVATGVSW